MTAKQLTAPQVYKRILDYCNDRVHGTGGVHTQEPYKHDFFMIFVEAYHHCRGSADFNRRQAKLKRKKLVFREHVVTKEGIRDHLAEWLKENPSQGVMVDELSCWWDEWLYAWCRFPAFGSRRGWQHFREV